MAIILRQCNVSVANFPCCNSFAFFHKFFIPTLGIIAKAMPFFLIFRKFPKILKFFEIFVFLKFVSKRIYLGPSKNLYQKGPNLCQKNNYANSKRLNEMLQWYNSIRSNKRRGKPGN